jgi:hypothetical protein
LGIDAAGTRVTDVSLPVTSGAGQLSTMSAELSELAERRERVEQALTSAAGGASLCSISRSAGPVPGIKYLEGQMAALMELDRVVRRGDDLASASAEILERWSARLDGARQRGMSADWIAYYAGGVDELTAASRT